VPFQTAIRFTGEPPADVKNPAATTCPFGSTANALIDPPESPGANADHDEPLKRASPPGTEPQASRSPFGITITSETLPVTPVPNAVQGAVALLRRAIPGIACSLIVENAPDAIRLPSGWTSRSSTNPD
jgi:hypothetical protein